MPKGSNVTDQDEDKPSSRATLQIDQAISVCLKGFGQQLRAQRKSRRLTQQDMEQRSGITQSGLSKAETGDGNIGMKTLIQIAIGLQVKPSFLAALLDGCASVGAVNITTLGNTPVAIDDSADADTLESLEQELASRGARASKRRRKSGNRRA